MSLFLALALGVPSHAHALRNPQPAGNAGLEEQLAEALRSSATGLEEPPLLREGIILPGGHRFDVGAWRQIGKRRELQDEYRVLLLSRKGRDVACLTVLADGMGHLLAGGTAAHWATRRIPLWFSRNLELLELLERYPSLTGDERADAQEKILDAQEMALQVVHREMALANQRYLTRLAKDPQADRKNPERLLRYGTGVVLGLGVGSDAFIRSVGDLREYLIRGGRLELLTPDDHVRWRRAQEELGRATPPASLLQIAEAALAYQSYPNALTQCLGKVETTEWRTADGREALTEYALAEIDVHGSVVEHLQPGDLLLSTTDGVHQPLSAEELRQAASGSGPAESLRERVERIMEQAGRRGKDNRGLVMTEYRGVAAGMEDSFEAIKAPATPFREFLGRLDLPGLLQENAGQAIIRVMEAGQARPDVEAMREAGYSGVYLGRPRVPAAKTGTTLSIYVQEEWRGEAEPLLAEAPGITLVETQGEAQILIADFSFDEKSLEPHQVLLRVNAETVKEITSGLIRHLEREGLLRPGSIVEIETVVRAGRDKALLIFA